jgi:hypothetical protein
MNEQTTGSGREERDSVFLHANVIATHHEAAGVFRVRNISSGGLMAEGPFTFHAGDELDVELRNIGTVHGRVAWASSGKFGMMFDRVIDPKLARKPVGGGAAAPEPTRLRPIVPPFSGRTGSFAT